jgi:tripartite-type tricarboxylate transporter receptor subunit TctC
MRRIIDDPKVKETLARVGFEAFSSSQKELEDHINIQLAKWKKMVDDAGIQPE